jgi:integrase/recombinase XerD
MCWLSSRLNESRCWARGSCVSRTGESGLSARTIKRRLASIAGLYEYLIIRGDTAVSQNPVPRGLALRRPGQRGVRGVPLIRAPRTLPRVIDPGEADAFLAALRTTRDRAMIEAMLLGGLRRCEVLGLRLGDVRPGERRLFIAEGKGAHQRIVPLSGRFFTRLGDYLATERPELAADDHVFLIQAQAGHRSIESTRIYLHLANDWLAGEYRRASEAIDAQAIGGQ